MPEPEVTGGFRHRLSELRQKLLGRFRPTKQHPHEQPPSYEDPPSYLQATPYRIIANGDFISVTAERARELLEGLEISTAPEHGDELPPYTRVTPLENITIEISEVENVSEDVSASARSGLSHDPEMVELFAGSAENYDDVSHQIDRWTNYLQNRHIQSFLDTRSRDGTAVAINTVKDRLLESEGRSGRAAKALESLDATDLHNKFVADNGKHGSEKAAKLTIERIQFGLYDKLDAFRDSNRVNRDFIAYEYNGNSNKYNAAKKVLERLEANHDYLVARNIYDERLLENTRGQKAIRNEPSAGRVGRPPTPFVGMRNTASSSRSRDDRDRNAGR